VRRATYPVRRKYLTQHAARLTLHDLRLLQIYMQLSKNSIVETHRYASLQIGGGERDRTDDPLRARQVLSQLSYTPGKLQVRGSRS
jgi:hypothetical protein